jgi:succinate-acetate transporter protein
MNNKFSGFITLGYASIFISFWLGSMVFAGWTTFAALQDGAVILMILGIVTAISGIFSFFTNDKLECTLFLIFGTYIFSFMLRFIMYPKLAANSNLASFDGWITLLIAIVFFYLWLASFKGSMYRQLFLLLLWLSMLAIAITNLFSITFFMYIGGYLGLIASLFAGWYSATTILKSDDVPTSSGTA